MAYLQKYHSANLPELMKIISKNGIGMDEYLDQFFNSYETTTNYPPYNLIHVNNVESVLEIALGFTPVGVAIDAGYLAWALYNRDAIGAVLAGIGFIPLSAILPAKIDRIFFVFLFKQPNTFFTCIMEYIAVIFNLIFFLLKYLIVLPVNLPFEFSTGIFT